MQTRTDHPATWGGPLLVGAVVGAFVFMIAVMGTYALDVDLTGTFTLGTLGVSALAAVLVALLVRRSA